MHVVDGKVTPDFARLMVQVADAYPSGGNLTATSIQVYAWALSDYSVDAVRDACLGLVRDGSGFFPSVSEILRRLGVASVDDAATLAWAQFRRAAADVGAYASLDVEDVVAADAFVRVFGSWHEYCALPDGAEMAQRRKEFVAAYRAERAAPRSATTAVRRLYGLLESGGGYEPTSRSLVGRMTLAGGVELRPERGLPEPEIEP